jgi:hypothetical protein
MAYPPYVREKAREMRVTKRLTIDEIATRLAVARTTVFYWVRDIPVPRSEFDPRPMSEARRRAARANRDKHARIRTAAYEAGLAEFQGLAEEPTFTDFVCMYIGEGSKKDRHRVAICNSDPAAIRLGKAWITRFSRNPVSYALQYHADQQPDQLQSYWGLTLQVDPDRVRLQRKSNSGQLSGRTWRSPSGVLTVSCCDVIVRARLGAWMDAIRSTWP